MADHVVSLSDTEEAALRDLVARSRDLNLTLDNQLTTLARNALIPFVQRLVAKQAQSIEAAFVRASSDARTAVSLLLSDDKPDIRVETDDNGNAVISVTAAATPLDIKPVR